MSTNQTHGPFLVRYAPELLEHLERATAWIQEFADGAIKPTENGLVLLSDCHQLIAKARGES